MNFEHGSKSIDDHQTPRFEIYGQRQRVIGIASNLRKSSTDTGVASGPIIRLYVGRGGRAASEAEQRQMEIDLGEDPDADD